MKTLRLVDHKTASDLTDSIRSVSRKGHTTETPQICVHNDIISAVDTGNGVVLILLNLSAAFDTVDNAILAQLP